MLKTKDILALKNDLSNVSLLLKPLKNIISNIKKINSMLRNGIDDVVRNIREMLNDMFVNYDDEDILKSISYLKG